MGTLATRTAGSRLAIVVTTVIVTTAVLAGGVALATVGINSVGSPEIKNNSIRSVDIKDNQVRSSDIAFGQVSSEDIGTGQVKSIDIKDNQIRSSDIAFGQVMSEDIGSGQVKSIDIADGTITSADLANRAQPAGVAFAGGSQSFSLDSSARSVRSVVVKAPAAGHVVVTASGYVVFREPGLDWATCSITDGATVLDLGHAVEVKDSGIETSRASIPLSATRTFVVPAGTTTFRLVCSRRSGSPFIFNSQITALYVPASYAP